MKKLALTSLLVLITIRFVSACELPPETIPFVRERLFYDNLLFYSSLLTVLPIIILSLLKKGKELGMVAIAIFSAIFFTFMTILTTASDGCGDNCPTDLCGN